MAVNAGLLDDRLPMAAASFKLPDLAGAIDKGITMRGDMIQNREKERSINASNDDRNVMQDYLKNGGDMYTPVGLDKAMSDLKGKVSPELYGKLGAHHDTVKQKDIEYKESLLKMTGDELKLKDAQTEKTLSYLSAPLDAYNRTKGVKGEQDAGAEFDSTRKQVLEKMAGEKDQMGQPLYPPEMLQALGAADPRTVEAMLAGTKYHQAQVKQRLEVAQTDHATASAEVDRARAKVYSERGSLGSGRTSDIGLIDQDVAVGRISKEEGDAMKKGIVAKKSGAGDASGLTPDAINDTATKYYLTGDLPPRLSPAERVKIINRTAEIARDNGDTAEEASMRAQGNKAGKLALNDITKREALIGTYEKDADKRLGLVLELAKKADQNQVPALNRWINAGRQNIQGDVDVTNFNSAMVSAQAELARILSGALTNAATSDAARAEAANIINKNMNMEQLEALVPNIRRELKFKKDAFAEQRKEIELGMKTPNTQRKAADTANHEKISSDEQKKRDADAGKILTDELNSSRVKLAKLDPKDPEQVDTISRLKGDIDANLRELKKIKIAAPVDNTPAPAAKAAGSYSDAEKESRYQAWKKTHGGS